MIENTSQRIPAMHLLLGAMGDGADGYIESMEAAGQRQLIASTELPTDTHDSDDEFIALGFTFGAPNQDDPLFRPATLPEGWKKVGSDHAMGSYVVDGKGRKRVSIFYKAAFYDRRANMCLLAPTQILDGLYYGDDEPTAIELDDLLTLPMARTWIRKQREHDMEYRALAAGQGRDLTRYDDHLTRLDVMEALLPDD